MNEVRVSEMRNPFYEDPENTVDIYDSIDMEYNSDIYFLEKGDANGDNSRYEALMQKLIDPNDQTCALNAYVANPISKTWDVKSGKVLVHVEWIKFIVKEKKNILALVDGNVSGITRDDEGNRFITISRVPHQVPANLEIKVKVGDDVSEGDLLAGSETPKADDREY